MISRDALMGYVLEEVLASLVQTAGYRLITREWQDPDELTVSGRGDLQVRGRGADHQVDVLGELTLVPPFSQPLRLFVEAKARTNAVGLPVVRNAVGTINDVNEGWMVNHSVHRVRRHYRYSLFSTSGFTEPAQQYALAHQIALIDLSGVEWDDLRAAARNAADNLVRSVPERLQRGFRYPVRFVRELLREALHTDSVAPSNDARVAGEELGIWGALDRLALELSEIFGAALLLFPAGEQVILGRPNSLDAFLTRAAGDPQHEVRLSGGRGEFRRYGRRFVVRPTDPGAGDYTIEFTVPTEVEERALAETERRDQLQVVKRHLAGRLSVYWDPPAESVGARLLQGPRIFHLEFAQADLAAARRDADGGSNRDRFSAR
jgi:hypothetical protein